MTNWDDMRIFIAAARSRSFSAGGKRIGMDGSTVARRLQRLESSLKATLFVRSRRGLQLTAAGGRLLNAALDIESAMESVSGEDGHQAIAGLIRIGVPDGLGVALIAPALPAFVAERPGLSIELVASSAMRSASTREVDMMIAVGQSQSSRTTFEKLTDFELGLFGSGEYISRRGVPKSHEELNDHEFISYIDDLAEERQHHYFEEINLRVNAHLMSTSVHARMALVQAGGGLAILPHFLACRDENLVRILPEISLVLNFSISIYQDLEATARIRVVRRWLKELVVLNVDRLLPQRLHPLVSP